MDLKFSMHARKKCIIYQLNTDVILNKVNNSTEEFFDIEENSYIRIIEYDYINLAFILDKKREMVITLYPIDTKTIQNRKESKKWI